MKTYAKKSLSILLSLIMLLSCFAGLDFSAYSSTLPSSGSCGENVTYTFNKYTGELIISGTGPMTDYKYSDSPFYSNENITSIVINSGVTNIGDSVFNGCSNLTSIEIPNSVTSIGINSFASCNKLANLAMPNNLISIGEYAFFCCSKLSNINIPNSVMDISDNAFQYCRGLKSVTISKNLTSIGESSFAYCSSLTSVIIPDSVTSIGSLAFGNCTSLVNITIGNSVTSIGSLAFGNCTSLTNVTIGNSVTSIGRDAFYNCTSLTSVNINSIEAWCNISFYNHATNPLSYAHNLYLNGSLVTDLVIPDSVTSIGGYAFSYCTSLTSVTIPNSVTSIGSFAFYECTSLTSVNINSIEAWCNISFYDYDSNPFHNANNLYLNGNLVTDLVIPDSVTSIGNYAFYDYRSLTSVTIPDSVTSIGRYAFSYCTSLTSVTIPDSVTTIGNSAFEDCKRLTGVKIGNSVTSIGNSAFEDCTSLTSVTIPDSVTSIGNYAFRYCTSLTSITIPDSVTSIGSCAFYDCKNITSITIPDSVISIKEEAFHEVLNINYNGIATGSPWGARYVNGYVEGCLVYKDSSKKELVKCSSITKKVIIPNSVTSIGKYAFENCSAYLTSVDIPNSVISIGIGAFQNSGLTNITIPNSVTNIESSVFSGCSLLESVEIPDSITSIPNYMFEQCSSLSNITIPNSVTQIGCYAFNKCNNLSSITIPNSVTKIDSFAFLECKNLSSIIIPDSVTSIGRYSFENCTSLYSVKLSNKLKVIDDCLFYNCTHLRNVIIPNSVTSIGNSAFWYCTSLTSVTIPNSVKSIGSYAFYNCKNITSITIPNSVTYIGNSLFSTTDNLTHVNYCGTRSQFENLLYGSNNNVLLEATFDEHNYQETVHERTCKTDGYIEYECVCCKKRYESYPDELKAVGHIPSSAVKENDIKATCYNVGSFDTVVYCSECSEELSRETTTLPQHPQTIADNKDGSHTISCECGYISNNEPHSYKLVGGKYTCSVCGNVYSKSNTKTVSSLTTGNTITLGTYPQSRVTDANLISALNGISCCMISYDYRYNGGKNVSNMTYADIRYNGSVYRKVYIGDYRTTSISSASSTVDTSYQDNNGYTTGNTYYFKWEPIKWTVLGENTSYRYFITTSIIDAQPMNVGTDGATWEYSTIRKWLNDDFYNNAFSQMEKLLIKADTHSNVTNPNNNISGGNSTTDNVMLLDYANAINSSYGFSTTTAADTSRVVKGSAYSISQGLNVATDGYSAWWLRDIGNAVNSGAHVNNAGRIWYSSGHKQYVTYDGIRPVIKLAKADSVGNSDSATPNIVGHDFKNIVSASSTAITYSCTKCNSHITKDIKYMVDIWNEAEFNEPAENHPYFDVVQDNVINAKDFAKLKHIQKYGK